MEKTYMKPAVSLKDMLMESPLNTNSDPTKVEVGDTPTKPEDADAKQIDWTDYLEED